MSNDNEFRISGDLTLTAQLQAWSPPHGTPLINTLPTELFVQIMEEIRLADRRAGQDEMANPWILPYQFVCRHWRDVIRSTPSLWREIIVCNDAKWLELCLRRCAGVLATVHIWKPTEPEIVFATLGHYAPSIRAYHVQRVIPNLDGLLVLFATFMPALETLTLSSPHCIGEDLDVTITHDLVPRLTTLELRGCTAPRDVAVYTHLRSLTLLETAWIIPYTEFLDLLENCHGLERLHLDRRVLRPFAEELVNLDIRRRTVVLPRLRVMKLICQRALLAHLFATIHAPRATTIELIQCVDDDKPGALTTRLLAADSHIRYPLLSWPRAISIVCWEPFRLSIQCESDSETRFYVFYNVWSSIYTERVRNVYLKDDLIAVLEIFSTASIGTLKVEGCPESLAVDTWQGAFQSLPNLRTLHVQGMGTLDSLWRGLACATTASLERGGTVCCPSLSEIVVYAPSRCASPSTFEATRALFDLIPGVLRGRADAGGARLQKFQLYLQYTDAMWDQTSELHDAFVEDVKALVGELDYCNGRTEDTLPGAM